MVSSPSNMPSEHRVEDTGVSLLTHNPSTTRAGVANTTQRLYSQARNPIPIVKGPEWALGLVWRDMQNLAPTGVRTPDHPACSKSP
jgi:hypothetical protein